MMIYWLALAAIFAVGLVALRHLHALRQLHHLYIGAALALFALLPYWVQLALALAVVFDDAMQHVVQCWRPEYASPLHRLYAWAYARGMR